ncbi:reverse transcriptase domain-containing protein [Tanacetum coccineum]
MFGVVEGMFLGYMISPEGIKSCPDKTDTVLQLPSPQTIKEVQSLNGKLASLNRFLSKRRTSLQATKVALVRATPAGGTQTEGGTDREHNITYRPRTPVKGQILADFLVEKPNESPPDTSVVETPQELWTLFMDGSSCVDGSDAGLILTSLEGTEFTYALRFQFTSSNNEVEYEALIAGLRIASQMGVRNVYASVDSKLVANQVLGAYVAKEENMIKYLEKVLVKILKEKSIQEKEVTIVVKEDGLTWMTLIIEYLKEGTILDDKKEASKLRIKARQYELWEGVLYRQSFLKPWLRNPQQLLTPITALWPFYKWGINIAGPFPEGPGKVKFLIVAMEYFTKWIEAKAVSTITRNQVKAFVWDNIVCRFDLPEEIVSDNGKEFSDNPFKDWCEKLNITQCFASVKHSQSNRLMERANQSLGDGIKARLGKGNKNWIEELPHVLWAHLDVVHNDEEIRLYLDLLEERCERAAIREANAKLQMTKYYNARVRGVTFRPGDFVYRSNDASHAVARGKLGPKWEGPYEVTEALRDGAYRLRSMDGSVFLRTWNIANLKKCYL